MAISAAQSASPAPEILDHLVQRRIPPAAGLLDRPEVAGGEALAGLLRAGNAGSNTATDHVTVMTMALA
jgi:hypothetical protein